MGDNDLGGWTPWRSSRKLTIQLCASHRGSPLEQAETDMPEKRRGLVTAEPAATPDNMDAAIGFVVRSWSNAEIALSFVLSELSNTDTLSGLTISSALDFKHRKNIVRALSTLKLSSSPDIQKRLESALKNIERLGRVRNRFAHGLLAQNPATSQPETITLRTAHQFHLKLERASPEEAIEAGVGLNEAANDLFEIAALAAPVIRAWHASRDIPAPPYRA